MSAFWKRFSDWKSASRANRSSALPKTRLEPKPKPQHQPDPFPIRVRILSALVDIQFNLRKGKFYEAGAVTSIVQVLIAKIADLVTLYGKTYTSQQLFFEYCTSLNSDGRLDDPILNIEQVYDVVSNLVVQHDNRRGTISELEKMRVVTRDCIQQSLQWGFMVDVMNFIDPEGLCSREEVSFQNVPKFDASIAVPRCEKVDIEESQDAVYWPTSLVELETPIRFRTSAVDRTKRMDSAASHRLARRGAVVALQ